MWWFRTKLIPHDVLSQIYEPRVGMATRVRGNLPLLVTIASHLKRQETDTWMCRNNEDPLISIMYPSLNKAKLAKLRFSSTTYCNTRVFKCTGWLYITLFLPLCSHIFVGLNRGYFYKSASPEFLIIWHFVWFRLVKNSPRDFDWSKFEYHI